VLIFLPKILVRQGFTAFSVFWKVSLWCPQRHLEKGLDAVFWSKRNHAETISKEKFQRD